MIQGLSDRLIALREQHGYSQRKLAELIQIAPSAISAYESNTRTPSIEVLMALSSIYRVSVDYLLGIEKKIPGKMLDVTKLTDEQITALRSLISVME